VDVESVDLLDTHALQTGVDGLFNCRPFQLTTVIRGQREDLSVDSEALRDSFGLADQFLRAPRRSRRVSAGSVEVSDVFLLEIVENFLYIFRIDKVHAKGSSAENELRDTHIADDNWGLRVEKRDG